jgi:hypothetical protein
VLPWVRLLRTRIWGPKYTGGHYDLSLNRCPDAAPVLYATTYQETEIICIFKYVWGLVTCLLRRASKPRGELVSTTAVVSTTWTRGVMLT